MFVMTTIKWVSFDDPKKFGAIAHSTVEMDHIPTDFVTKLPRIS